MSIDISLVDNSLIYSNRTPLQVDPEVSSFVFSLFTLDPKGKASQKASYSDVIRLLKSTELYSILEGYLGVTQEGVHTLLPSNYWISFEDLLASREEELEGFFKFYRNIFEAENKKELFIFLKETWDLHRNTAYRLGSIITMHVLGLDFLGKRRC